MAAEVPPPAGGPKVSVLVSDHKSKPNRFWDPSKSQKNGPVQVSMMIEPVAPFFRSRKWTGFRSRIWISAGPENRVYSTIFILLHNGVPIQKLASSGVQKEFKSRLYEKMCRTRGECLDRRGALQRECSQGAEDVVS